MEEIFKIPPDKVHSAFYHLLTEIYAQNCVMAEMFATVYANSTNQDLNEVRKMCQKNFEAQKKKIQSHIHLHFGDINLSDILGDE